MYTPKRHPYLVKGKHLMVDTSMDAKDLVGENCNGCSLEEMVLCGLFMLLYDGR